MTNNCYSCKYCKDKTIEKWHYGTLREVGRCEMYDQEVFGTDACSNYEEGDNMDGQNEELTELLTVCGKHPEEFNKIGNILYGFFGHPIGAETQLLCTYVYLKMKEKERKEEGGYEK